MSKLKQFSASRYTSELSQSLSSNFQLFQRATTHSSSLVEDLSSQRLSKCPTSEDFTLTTDQLKTLLAWRLSTPTHTYTPGSKCPCGARLGDSGVQTSSSCSKGRSLHTTHSQFYILLIKQPVAKVLVLLLNSLHSLLPLALCLRKDLT